MMNNTEGSTQSSMRTTSALYSNILQQVRLPSFVAGVVIGAAVIIIGKITSICNTPASEPDCHSLHNAYANHSQEGKDLFGIYATSAALFGTGGVVVGFLSAVLSGLGNHAREQSTPMSVDALHAALHHYIVARDSALSSDSEVVSDCQLISESELVSDSELSSEEE